MSADETERKPILVAEGVRKVYRSGADSVVALHGLDLVVPQGEFVAVMGPSGSGKTTLLNCLSGLDEIDDGRVLVDGLSIHELSDEARTQHRAEAMGFIFQAFNLIPVFTATENVELPLLLAGVREQDARHPRARDAHASRPRPQARPPADGALGRRAAARRDRAGAGGPAAPRLGRRAHGQPRLGDGGGGHGPARRAPRRGADAHPRHARPDGAARADRLITVKDGGLVGDERLGASGPKRDENARERCCDEGCALIVASGLAPVPLDPRPPAGAASPRGAQRHAAAARGLARRARLAARRGDHHGLRGRRRHDGRVDPPGGRQHLGPIDELVLAQDARRVALALWAASLAAGFEGRRRPAARNDRRRPPRPAARKHSGASRTPRLSQSTSSPLASSAAMRLPPASGRDTRGGSRCHHDRPCARSRYRARSADRCLCLRQAADADRRSHPASPRRRRLLH